MLKKSKPREIVQSNYSKTDELFNSKRFKLSIKSDEKPIVAVKKLINSLRGFLTKLCKKCVL